MRKVGSANARIDGADEGIDGVLLTLEVGWQSDIALLISVIALAHL